MNSQQQPLLEVKNLVREFPAGESTVQILKGVNLEIYPGELVAIVGQSGSGKSTLMNILGCLDKPTTGSYKVKGRETRELEADELAQLRREYFGFIFQRYHLLGDLNAAGNVEVPAIYAGADSSERHARAVKILTDLGLGEKTLNRPSQLSGGQQQRVSIARALMNGGDVILADEPTGALDKNSGIEVMRILRELNAKGHTIILVTHDHNVAKNATRIIEISDGNIISDQPNVPEVEEHLEKQPLIRSEQKKISSWRSAVDRLGEAFRMALLAMNAHRMRTFLTMLGIIIGIASVVSVVALGNGSQKQILENISSLGTNTITVFQGRGFGDNSRSSQSKTLIPADADALAEQPYVDGVSPSVNSSVTGRYKEIEASTTVNGVSEDFFYVRGMTFQSGQPFDRSSVMQQAQDVVIDTNTKNTFFKDGTNPVGQVILLGSVPSRIIGVIDAQKGMMGNNDSLNVYLPYSTVMSRMLGQSNVRSIIVRIKDEYPSAAAENAILNLLVQRHGAQDVFTQNADSIRETIQQTTATMTLLISAIAVISLVVGGIGVMNIMLVSVTERTQEIGVRMAVGARQSDILQQFLIEAVLVCILGGILGVLLSLGIGQLITHFAGGTFQMAYSTTSIVAAFVCSSLIGIVFGFIPARNAARLNPVDALSRE
ncbi:MacB family efflux pump subunit [Acinetobacter lwoffii]|jgi:macrolide transport system ATP-binding/permease protein|uniref:Pyoverdine export ATP-binding/permease protein PvdT n=1 Tax=Acinetobacter lwoffii NCTC 5866 = CIP 64.10 = NIPH 512 TaxID=981327 RepID=A0ABN0PU99_ACILW|nr:MULTISPECIES: MacB family efflux pump subunit [Acinetobacter]EAM8864204.1 MacB family efflux pump subunit [Salmonella enterica]ENU15740.1 macrolide export ATP-binding/permease MacB [Acinetobacter sp. CIP A162]ESJ94059.1 macrolide export ATP-binding/permease MacB [Acinetobacter lwoffii NCTC 5866 = CIP 64.10 = NIPH 512]MCO8061483.1 MacB family efflux pump subunit [Acinetobacter lwoffii]MCO8080639.1 MacB family efflux pump subunit [Acinetobacter lwoffii]